MTGFAGSLYQKLIPRPVFDEPSSWSLLPFPGILLIGHRHSEFRDLAHLIIAFYRWHPVAGLLLSQLAKNPWSRMDVKMDVVTNLMTVLKHILYPM
jgi:hypothetical protein